MSNLEVTGERYIPGMRGDISLEHMHRYAMALSFARHKCVLDIACGEGYGSNLLASEAGRVIGVDISEDVIKHAQKRYTVENIEFRHGSCALLPVESNSVDLVVSFETIEHHDTHNEMMREIVRVLKPDGQLLISSPNKEVFSGSSCVPSHFHVKELYLDEFRVLLEKYFLHVDIFGQKVLRGSVVAPLRTPATSLTFLSEIKDSISISNEISSEVYYIALARNADIPAAHGCSIYSSDSSEIDSNKAPTHFETKIYWKEFQRKGRSEYSEEKALSRIYSVDGKEHQVILKFPDSVSSVTSLRVDIADAVGVIDITSIDLCTSDGSFIWNWSGDVLALGALNQCIVLDNLISGVNGCTVISLGRDSQIELNLSADIYELINAGSELSIRLVPYALDEKLPEIIHKFVCERRVGNSEGNNPGGWCFELIKKSSLESKLNELSDLVKGRLDNYRALYANQNYNIRALRENLVRAEAQLDLLKNVMLDGLEKDRL